MVGEAPKKPKKADESDLKEAALKAAAGITSNYQKRLAAFENLKFYEGVMVGAYTNWLVSFLDKLNVERVEAFRYHAFAEAIIASFLFLSLILYFLSSPRSTKLWGFHILCVNAIIILEVIQFPDQNYLKLAIFYFMGMLLWLATHETDNLRDIILKYKQKREK